MTQRVLLGFPDALSALFDSGVSDARLEQLARMTAAKFFSRQQEDEIGRTWTFLFKGKGTYVYIVLPIFRRRYYAVVRIEGLKTTMGGAKESVTAEDFEVQSVSVHESDALRLASHALSEEP
jgi:hypothetical protein